MNSYPEFRHATNADAEPEAPAETPGEHAIDPDAPTEYPQLFSARD